MKKYNLNDNPELKKKFRFFGWIILIIGIVFMVTAFVDFFSAVSGFGQQPTLFWMFFLGMPFLMGGFVLLKFGYMGAVTRYTSSQVAPVAKDTINYMLDGTKDSIANVARGIKGESVKTCENCGNENDDNAKFCDECGAPLFKECPNCHSKNDQDAKFCDECGEKI